MNKNPNPAQRAYHRNPYPTPAYRGARGRGRNPYYGSTNPQYRNRTLHVHNKAQSISSNAEQLDGESPASASEAWVSKRDRHLQLINKSVYDKMVEEQSASDSSKPASETGTYSARALSMIYHIHILNTAISPLGTIASNKTPTIIAKPPLVLWYDRDLIYSNLHFRVKTELCRNFCSTGKISHFSSVK